MTLRGLEAENGNASEDSPKIKTSGKGKPQTLGLLVQAVLLHVMQRSLRLRIQRSARIYQVLKEEGPALRSPV